MASSSSKPNGVNGTHNGSHDYDDDEEEIIIDDSEIDFTEIERKYKSKVKNPFESVVVVSGLPIVGEDRKSKLFGALVKYAGRNQVTVTAEAFTMPMDNGTSKGFMFVQLSNVKEAQSFIAVFDDWRLDKSHTLSAFSFTDVEKYTNVSDTFVPPPAETYEPREHLRSWLGDPASRDQVSLFSGEDMKIAYLNRNGTLTDAYSKRKWTDHYASWSSQGTLLFTSHIPGVIAWGGASFNIIHRLPQKSTRPKLIEFSPFENYVVTWSDVPCTSGDGPFGDEDEGNDIVVWDVWAGKPLRTFDATASSVETAPGGSKKINWPVMRWSPDEKYLARVSIGQSISVYEVPSMGLLDKKSIKLEGVKDFAWRPATDEEEAKKGKKPWENMLAFWTPDDQNQPARVTVMAIPSRTSIRSKNLFNVSDCQLFWQSQGDFLCVKVDRHTKTKKSTFCNLEIFRIRENDTPVQTLEIKDTVIQFSWEPKGDRFVLIHSSDPNATSPVPGVLPKTSVSFYGFDAKKGDFRLLRTYDGKTCNLSFWSPKGRHVILCTLGSSSKYDLEFWDLDLNNEGKPEGSRDLAVGIQLVKTFEHYGMTDVEWDPSGRYVGVYGSMWKQSLETGFGIYDWRGEELFKQNVERFKQLSFRPRPKPLISKEVQKKVRKNLREYSRQFDEEDSLEEMNVSAELQSHRRRLIEEWNAWRAKMKKELESEGGESLKKIEEETEWLDEFVEEVIAEKEEVVA